MNNAHTMRGFGNFLLAFFVFVSSVAALAQNRQLVGLTSRGGKQFGTVLSLPVGGNSISQVKHLAGIPGGYPTRGLIEVNGKLYGTTPTGGKYNKGLIFEFDPALSGYRILIDLSDSLGFNPSGELLLASNGKLYGLASQGGDFAGGVLFELDVANLLFKKCVDFYTGQGRWPVGSLIQATNGKLYGMTKNSLTSGKGTIFEYDITNNNYSTRFELQDSTGGNPEGSLVQAMNGKLYGFTREGGANNEGVLFEFDLSTNTYLKKHDLNDSTGSFPVSSLLSVPGMKLIGMTTGAGAYGFGTILEYDLSTDSINKLFDFSDNSGYPTNGSLVEINAGNVAGFTAGGSVVGYGTIFVFDYVNHVFTQAFTMADSSGYDPRGNLCKAQNGTLFGITRSGGRYGAGVIFEYNSTTDTYREIFDFGESEGSQPTSSLVQASNDKLYGLTMTGGTYNSGTIFEYDFSSNTYTRKIDLNDSTGYRPSGSLAKGPNGKLYGIAPYGARNHNPYHFGCIFEYDPVTNRYTQMQFFDTLIFSSGYVSMGSLTLSSNGYFYGTTTEGGDYEEGAIFNYDLVNNSITKLFSFSLPDGIQTLGSLVEGSNGMLYGLTRYGGANNCGVVFQFNPLGNVFTKLIDLSDSLGRNPDGGLVYANNGKLYGFTSNGGANGTGVIFEFDLITNSYQIVHHFPTGSYGNGTPVQASNSKLYGMTVSYGFNRAGSLFEFDISSHIYTELCGLDWATGYFPLFGQLIEIDATTVTTWVNELALCNGSSFEVNYSTPPALSGNVFSVELSDAAGSFNTPITIGSVTASVTGSIPCTLPTNIPPGTGYRVRVVGSQPAVIGNDNAVNITIYPAVSVSCSLLSSDNCDGYGGAASVLASGGTSQFAYTWSPIGGTLANATGLPAGTYSVHVTDLSCGVDSCTLQVVYGPPPITSIASAPPFSCTGVAAQVQASSSTPATTFNWNSRPQVVFNGQTGPVITSDSLVNILFPSSSAGTAPNWNVCVKATNDCGVSVLPACVTIQSTAIQPGPIIGPSIVSPGTISLYSTSGLTNATSFQWTATGSDISVAGSGSNATVTIGPLFTGGTLCVWGLDECGVPGPARCRNLSIQASDPLVNELADAVGLLSASHHTQCFPNPTTGEFMVSISATLNQEARLTVYNLLGIPIQVGKIPMGQSSTTIELNAFEPGIYRLVIESASGSETHSIVLMR